MERHELRRVDTENALDDSAKKPEQPGKLADRKSGAAARRRAQRLRKENRARQRDAHELAQLERSFELTDALPPASQEAIGAKRLATDGEELTKVGVGIWRSDRDGRYTLDGGVDMIFNQGAYPDAGPAEKAPLGEERSDARGRHYRKISAVAWQRNFPRKRVSNDFINQQNTFIAHRSMGEKEVQNAGGEFFVLAEKGLWRSLIDGSYMPQDNLVKLQEMRGG